MRELDDVINDAAESGARSLAGLAMDGAALAALTLRVRRRRAVRHAVQGIVAIPVAGLLAAGGWFAMSQGDPRPPIPATTTSTSPSPSASPSATALPSASPGAIGEPVTEPGLPTYYPMPAGLLAQAGPGWVLATYAPDAVDHPAAEQAPLTEVVLLVSPDGTRYLVRRLELDVTPGADGPSWVEHRVVEWQPGSTTAVVETRPVATTWSQGSQMAGSPTYATLDLVTGSLAPAFDPPLAGARFVGQAGARRLWSSPGGTDLLVEEGSMLTTLTLGWTWDGRRGLSPDGDLFLGLDEVADLSAGSLWGSLAESTAPGHCSPVTWWTRDSVLALCIDEDPATTEKTLGELGPRWVTFTKDQWASGAGTEIRSLHDGDIEPVHGGLRLGDGDVLVAGSTMDSIGTISPSYADCSDGLYRFTADRTDRVLAVGDPRLVGNILTPYAVGGTVVIEVSGNCSGEAVPSALLGYDASTGAVTELIPPPSDAATTTYTQGLTSFVVGASH
ncbi:MAG TPA: hypothetical protein VGK35_00230 [Actinotalea sp.]